MALSRRGFFVGLGAAIAAPAIVRAASLMPVRALSWRGECWTSYERLILNSRRYHVILGSSMFADLMSAKTEILGINRAEIDWWQRIAIKSEMIPA